ncbi:MAG TPA: isochorismatase [Gemmatimonadota bacterium]|nr:isochorismatase [Gemmatimonadota bacterium]
MSEHRIPIPPHYDADRVGEVWRVPYRQRAVEAAAWAQRHDVRTAAKDETTVCLVLVDCQNTFCIPEFELFVAGRSGRGAVDDNARLCEFIYRNLGRITQIAPTMDTHTSIQIFHPIFWVNEAGEHPGGGETVIPVEDVERGVWKVNPAVAAAVAGGDLAYVQRHALHYVRSLTEGGKYPLLVWPYHAMLGGIGHALVSAVEEAVFFHSVARAAQPRFEIKGNNPLTEHYSVLGPEVDEGPDGEPIADKNAPLIQRLLECDAVIIAGQAKSHCVAWTIHDLLTEVRARDSRLVEKVYLLEDCTSPVVVPGVVDFTEQADEAFASFAAAGMHVVRSTEKIEDWPGL